MPDGTESHYHYQSKRTEPHGTATEPALPRAHGPEDLRTVAALALPEGRAMSDAPTARVDRPV